MSELATYTNEQLLEVQEALALQSLAMKYAFPKATSIKDGGGMYRFMLYRSPGQEVGIESNETLSFMGICLGRTALNMYKMRVSFLELDLRESQRYSNRRELYCLDWMPRNEYCFGTIKIYGHYGEITESSVDELGRRRDEVVAHISKEELHMAPEHCDSLAEKILHVTEQVAA